MPVPDTHTEEPYRVVGVLSPTHTPADLGIFVPLSSYWHVHTAMEGSIFEPAALNAELDNGLADMLDVTAVLVRAHDISRSYQLYQALNTDPDVQAALPGAVLTQLLGWLGQGQRVLSVLAYVAVAIAAISISMSMYSAVLAQQHDTAVLRSLGASRRVVVRIALWESFLLGVIGVVLGLLLGHVSAAWIGSVVSKNSAIAITTGLERTEVLVVGVMLVLGVSAGLLPAYRVYHVNMLKALSNS